MRYCSTRNKVISRAIWARADSSLPKKNHSVSSASFSKYTRQPYRPSQKKNWTCVIVFATVPSVTVTHCSVKRARVSHTLSHCQILSDTVSSISPLANRNWISSILNLYFWIISLEKPGIWYLLACIIGVYLDIIWDWFIGISLLSLFLNFNSVNKLRGCSPLSDFLCFVVLLALTAIFIQAPTWIWLQYLYLLLASTRSTGGWKELFVDRKPKALLLYISGRLPLSVTLFIFTVSHYHTTTYHSLASKVIYEGLRVMLICRHPYLDIRSTQQIWAYCHYNRNDGREWFTVITSTFIAYANILR